MYVDHYLKFQNKTEWEANRISTDISKSVDVVGVIYWPAILDADGNVIKEAQVQDGFHVNIRSKIDLPASLLAFQIQAPKQPKRTWQ